jgi:hypothetical protein
MPEISAFERLRYKEQEFETSENLSQKPKTTTKKPQSPGIVVHAYNPSTQEPRLHSETLSQKKKEKNSGLEV